ncbi:hypothetical protein F2P81_015581 [Scophthalmus maximus]|uniref:Uncharacterized protein n=1 Tax=Scophthalmus maximus TaxID=52904 RepID=A0A6A4SQK6_SCOMX|nr:hypothetical protein F2P81_015581 [Scophthalmus maximus]
MCRHLRRPRREPTRILRHSCLGIDCLHLHSPGLHAAARRVNFASPSAWTWRSRMSIVCTDDSFRYPPSRHRFVYFRIQRAPRLNPGYLKTSCLTCNRCFTQRVRYDISP